MGTSHLYWILTGPSFVVYPVRFTPFLPVPFLSALCLLHSLSSQQLFLFSFITSGKIICDILIHSSSVYFQAFHIYVCCVGFTLRVTLTCLQQTFLLWTVCDLQSTFLFSLLIFFTCFLCTLLYKIDCP